jgi:hypothetical protein
VLLLSGRNIMQSVALIHESRHISTRRQPTNYNNNNNNSVALVRERTIPTERPPLVVEVSANFCG